MKAKKTIAGENVSSIKPGIFRRRGMVTTRNHIAPINPAIPSSSPADNSAGTTCGSLASNGATRHIQLISIGEPARLRLNAEIM